MEQLSQASLSKLQIDINRPEYDRKKVSVGIFHFGCGNFHRAHQALIMDSLFSKGLGMDYGICGVGVLPQDVKMRDVLQKQDTLYTCIEKSSDGKFNYQIIGSIVDYMFAPDNVSAVIERLCTNDAKIVTLTITEGGYNINPCTNDFDILNKTVQDDLKNQTAPKSVFGIVIEALKRRKERGMNGFTILSCDNLQENGRMAKKAFLGYAKGVNQELADWVLENVTFPNSMVDRITPVTTDDDRKHVTEKIKQIDDWPVVCEDFIHWVIEDNFVDGKRPPFESHPAVQLVKDVEPYELMKLRIINAGHQAIAYFGLLLDFKYVHDVTRHDLIAKFIKAYMDKEATSTLKEVKGIDLDKYKAKTIERFQNANILDTLMRLAFDGSDRLFKFVIPVVVDRLAKNQSIWLSTAIIASFTVYLNKRSESGNTIDVVDRAKDKLQELNTKLLKDPSAIKEEKELFGDVVCHPEFVRVFGEIYKKITTAGSSDTLKWLIEM